MSDRRGVDPLPLGDPRGLPYSKGLMTRALAAAGLPIDHAFVIAKRLERDLAARHERTATIEQLEDAAASVLGDEDGATIVARVRRFAALQELESPIVLLVGGATGTGKSSVATEAAHRLGITRVTSTDFIRETMRAYFSPRSMPSIHHSTFEGEPPIDAFLDQTRKVVVGVDASIERAMTEGWSMVLEGVHLVPGLVPTRIDGALLVHAVLAIESERVHRRHFHVRDSWSGGVRPMHRYLDALEAIREIQAELVWRAGQVGVPVIESSDIEAATTAVLELVVDAATKVGAAR